MVRRASRVALLAGLVLALVAIAWAQSTTPAKAPSPNAPTTEPAPGTAAVGGDVPAAVPSSPGSSKTAPGTAPASGETPAVNVNPDKVIEPGSQWTSAKTGSIDDVNAVGNRDIGGRG